LYKNRIFRILKMQHVIGTSRHQLRISSLEDAISLDNQVCFIDTFVGIVDFGKLGFALQPFKSEGRPSYNSKLFLKIYLYGYLNGIRSSRKLEKECFRNIEMQ
jgi:transposase